VAHNGYYEPYEESNGDALSGHRYSVSVSQNINKLLLQPIANILNKLLGP
jgi:hypothetical protein